MVDHPHLHELRQTAGQHAGGDARHPGPDHLEPLRREHQFAHDQQRPAVADQVERMGGKAAFVIADTVVFCWFSHFFILVVVF